jgi:hypothetical protein
MHKITSKKWIAIVGACTITTGLMIGGGLAAANATTVGVGSTASHIENHRGSDDVTPSTTPTTMPTPTATPTATPAPVPALHDDGDNDAIEHATPEPGDDDAPGTADHHGGLTGTDDNSANHESAGSGHDGSGHDVGDDNSGSGSSGHDGSDG